MGARGKIVKPETFLDGRVTLYCGDCIEVLAAMPENSVDFVCTDPPYHLQSIHKRFAAKGRNETSERYAAGPYGRTAKGFMGKQWDGGDIAFRIDLWAQVLRVLKPGGHLVASGGTRTFARMSVAIEDAGFEIRDTIMWLYGSGFPKSHNVGKNIDRMAGADREIVKQGKPVKRMIPGADQDKVGWDKNNGREYVPTETAPATAEAEAWDGWGTALKPACEPIVLARKPLSEGTVAANVLRWGVGGLNIDGCRIGDFVNTTPTGQDRYNQANFEHGYRPSAYPTNGRKGEPSAERTYVSEGVTNFAATPGPRGGSAKGRWPANIIHDGSDEVVAAFPAEAGAFAPVCGTEPSNAITNVYGARERTATYHHGDNGSAARFFYTAKADSDDRLGSKHPTVKPLDLMQYLIRLISPPGGIGLDLFAGTGTTGEAAWREGMRSILIEREPEYQEDIRRRMKLCMSGPDERARESIKAKQAGKPEDHGPLFSAEWDSMWIKPFNKPELL
jgi:site-specific DNA-methyltransferase (adenine-specific)